MKNVFIVYSAYILAIIGGVFGIVQYFLRKKNTKEAKLREMRFNVYSECLSKIDSINNNITSSFTKTLTPIFSDVFESILKNPEGSQDSLVNMEKALARETAKNVDLLSITHHELNKLRLVASKSILEISEEYQTLAKSQADDFCAFLNGIKFTDPNCMSALSKKIEAEKEKHERLNFLRKQLEAMMRNDLGAN